MRMKKAFQYITMLLLVIYMTSCNKTNDSSLQASKKEIKLLIEKRYEALNNMFKGDISLMKTIWSHADDVTYMGPAGGIKVRWKEVLKDWEFQASLKLGGKVTPSNIHITIGSDMAVVVNNEKGENIDTKGNLQTVYIRATHVLRKENGLWKIIAEHTDKLSFL